MLMPTVKCLCDSEILVVPDLKAMDIAITKHVTDHKQSRDDSKRLTDFLIEQVLIAASKNRNLQQYKLQLSKGKHFNEHSFLTK